MREAIVESFFETYGVNQLNLTASIPCMLINEGLETGIGIDLGEGAT